MSNIIYPIDRKGKLIGESVSVEVQLQKISRTGVSVQSSKKASVGSRLEVEFDIPAFGYIQRISIYAIVTHIHNNPKGFYISLDFEIITSEEQAMVEDFIAYKARLRQMGRRHFTHTEN